MSKKYFWLKLKDDFFNDIRMKKLRRNAGGATYTVIYLKLQLLSLKNEGILIYEEVEDSFYEEIAFKIDEDPVDVEFTLMFLIKVGLLEEVKQNEFALLETMQSIGSETQAAERVRKHREIKKEQKALQCNTDVTTCNTEIEKEKEKEKDIKPSSPKFSTFDLETSKLLFELMKINNPGRKEPKFEKWADSIRLMREVDKRSEEQIEYVVKWSQNHNFWKGVILSTDKLRIKYDDLVTQIIAEREKIKNNNNKQTYEKQTSLGAMMQKFEGGSNDESYITTSGNDVRGNVGYLLESTTKQY